MSDTLDYGKLMHNALRRLMADVLSQVAEDGLPGEHHFLIAFDTQHPGVDIPDWMRAQYPEEMTIVLQHWFDNLAVMGDRFCVTLNFNNTPEPMVIPLDAVNSFVDPSVEFGLRFDAPGDDAEEAAEPMSVPEETPKPDSSDSVVSLDAFRKT